MKFAAMKVGLEPKLKLLASLVCATTVSVLTPLFIGCTSAPTAVQSIKSIDYGRAISYFLWEGILFDDKGHRQEAAEPYWFLLKKGEVIASYLKEMRFTQKGVWESKDDFIDKITRIAYPEFKQKLTIEQKMELSKNVNDYFSKTLENLSERLYEHTGLVCFFKASLSRKSDSIAALRLEMQGKENKGDENAILVSKINEVFTELTKDEETQNGLIVSWFGLFTNKRASVEIKASTIEESVQKIKSLFEIVDQSGMTGYERMNETGNYDHALVQKYDPHSSINDGTSGTYYILWFRDAFFTNQPYSDYVDNNRTIGLNRTTVRCSLNVNVKVGE